MTTWVDSCYDVYKWVWPFTNLIAATATANTDGLIKYMDFNAPRSGVSVSFGFNVTPGIGQSITFNVVALTSGTANVQIGETINGNWTVLESELLDRTGNTTFHIVPTTGLVEARLLGPFRVRIGTVCIQKPVQTQQTFLVDVCSDIKDRYRFGFNGQEKVNEWAGIGNFDDFKYRGYDSRIARFVSEDPLTKKYPWYTPYQFAGNTPIQAKDLEGLEPIGGNAVLSYALGRDGITTQTADNVVRQTQQGIQTASNVSLMTLKYVAIAGAIATGNPWAIMFAIPTAGLTITKDVAGAIQPHNETIKKLPTSTSGAIGLATDKVREQITGKPSDIFQPIGEVVESATFGVYGGREVIEAIQTGGSPGVANLIHTVNAIYETGSATKEVVDEATKKEDKKTSSTETQNKPQESKTKPPAPPPPISSELKGN